MTQDAPPDDGEETPGDRILKPFPVTDPSAPPAQTSSALKASPQPSPSPTSPTVDKGGDEKRPPDPAGNEPDDEKAQTGKQPQRPQQPQTDAQCRQAAQNASAACSTANGGYGYNSGGISSYGSTLAGASGNAASQNIQAGARCTSAWRYCEYLCQSVNPSLASQCSSLAYRVQEMGDQARETLDGYRDSLAVSRQTGSMPNNDGAADELRRDAIEGKSGQSKFTDPEPRKSAEDFNVGISERSSSNYVGNGSGGGGAKPASVTTIPNNSGTPLGGGAAAAAIAAAQAAAQRAVAPGQGASTDIMQGERSGGGYQYHTGSGPTDEFNSFSRNARQPAAAVNVPDLRKFLPGGEHYGRRMGGFDPLESQINGKYVNMWEKITQRFHERCRLGQMLDCR